MHKLVHETMHDAAATTTVHEDLQGNERSHSGALPRGRLPKRISEARKLFAVGEAAAQKMRGALSGDNIVAANASG